LRGREIAFKVALGPHHALDLVRIDLVIATDINALALHRLELRDDLFFIVGKCLRQRSEAGGEVLVLLCAASSCAQYMAR
jgi:hypothetical protein